MNPPATTGSQPSILIVITDDLAYGDLSAHGNPHTRTTHLDALHDQSVRFERCCSGPLCTPARAALLTGRHPARTRAIDTYLGRSNLDAEERTLAHLCREAGYTTGCFGKWHLGDTPPNDPNSMGFDRALYHTGGGLRQPANAFGRNSYFDPDLIDNGRRVGTRGYCTDIITEAACAFIAQADGPFLAYVAYNAVHSPFEIVEQWADPFRAQGLPEVWCRLYGMLHNLDDNMGRLLGCLDEQGRGENTIVLFTSDHGPCASANHEGRPRYNAGLRGIKGGFYEGGIRVPSFWRWPRNWQPRGGITAPTSPMDVLPTLQAVCGLPPLDGRKIDGLNLAPVLAGGSPSENLAQRRLCMQWHRGARPIKGLNAACIGPQFKWYSVKPDQPAELYDLMQDPEESHNLADELPDQVREMAQTYDRWFADVCSERDLLNPDKEPGVAIEIPPDGVVLTWQDWVPYADREGFGADNPGYWLVTVARPGTYRVVVDRDPETHSAGLVFRFDEAEVRVPARTDVETLCFDVELPALTSRLHCTFETPAGRRGPQTVQITPHPVPAG